MKIKEVQDAGTVIYPDGSESVLLLVDGKARFVPKVI